jgi:uncharacterized membrane protein YfcA
VSVAIEAQYPSRACRDPGSFSAEAWMMYVIICTVAFLASALTFFSGFGLGTLLLPAFAIFFPVEHAVALTAIVHFINGVFKLFLVWRHIDMATVIRFGLLAMVGAFAGAGMLLLLVNTAPLLTYDAYGRVLQITAPKVVVGVLLLFFSCAELLPQLRRVSVPARYMPVGGLLSGFFGGVAGMQGALRSAFLVKAGLSREAYVATGAAIAFLIDVSRLSVYARMIADQRAMFDYALLGAAVLAAVLGATVGNELLPKVTMGGIQAVVAVMLFLVGAALIAGLL